ncbi:ATPase, T2SS/T4P/T4SS family [Streptomyces xanthochromogenes]|uniref:ATPase, T2SS/T4P/T4SS family n=1 Tax=Streptomyces xanthochromogenes TaxID=67384 RepID=UPI00341574E7
MTTPELEALTEQGLLNRVLADLLHAAVRARLNLIISGPGDSGRTTLLRALGCSVSGYERIATIETIPQMNLSRSGRLVLELSGPAAASMLPTALTQNVHRLLVDDMDGDMALPLLQAITGGASGSMVTVEAASPSQAVDRLAKWAAVPIGAAAPAARLVHSTVDLVVHLARLSNGAPAGTGRFVAHLEEAGPQAADGEHSVLRPLFAPVPGQPRAVFQNLPLCIDRLEHHGFDRAALADASLTWGRW